MRLGQTMVCVACALRFAPAARCPGCAGNRVLDLARPQGREAAWAAMGRRFRPLAPQPPPGAIDPDVPRETFTGVVRVAHPVRSPLRKLVCALFTIAGDTPGGAIADAGGASFDVHAADGTIATVELGDATVRPAYRARRQAIVDHVPFLEERGAYFAEWIREVAMVETIIADGDTVRIEGHAERRAAPSLYREARWMLVFRDRPLSPLVISPAD